MLFIVMKFILIRMVNLFYNMHVYTGEVQKVQ